MYIPRPWQYWYTFGFMFIGLYLGQQLPPTYDVVLAVVVCEVWALAGAVQISVDMAIYRGSRFEVTSPKAVGPSAYTATKRNIPQMFEQVVTVPKMDMERVVAIALLLMKDQGSKIDLTENKWVASKKFTYDKFVAFRQGWMDAGIIEWGSDAKNATPIVKDWQKVRMKAEGVPFPT